MHGARTTTPARLRAALASGAGGWSRNGVRSVTQYGRWVLGMSLVVAALGVLRGDVWMYLIALIGMAAFAVSWFAVPHLPQLEMRLVAPAVEVVGEPTSAQLVVRAGARPVPRQHVSVHVDGDAPGDPEFRGLPRGVHGVIEAMGPGETQAVDLVLVPTVRGHHDAFVVSRWTGAPFGLVRRSSAATGSRARTVSAGLKQSRVAPATRPGDGNDPHPRIARDGTDVHALRGWSAGDGSAIHWRSTARRNEPVVVDRETPEETGLVVVAGPAASDESADAVIAWAGGMAVTAALEGAAVHVVSAAGAVALGRNDREALLEWTASAQPAPATPEMAAFTADLAGPRGRIAVVHGRGAHSDVWSAVAASRGADVVDHVVDARPEPPAPRAVAPALDRPLALAVLASLVGGVLCVLATGALTGTGATAAAVGLVTFAAYGLLWPPTRFDPRVRSALSLVILGFTAVIAVSLVDVENSVLAPAAVVGLCGVAAAQVVGARTRRDGLVALGLGPLMVIVAAGLAPSPALVLPALAVAAAVMLGMAACADAGLAEGVPGGARTAARPPLVPAAAVVALAVVVFLLPPLGSAASFGQSLLGDRQGAPTPAQLAAEQTTSYFSGAMDLAARGHLPETTALEVAPGSAGLWRAMTLDSVYDGVWSTDSTNDELTARGGQVKLPADPAEAGAPAGTAHDYRVLPVDAQSIVAPGMPQTVSGPDSVWQAGPDAFLLNAPPAEYTVTAVPVQSIDTVQSSGTGPDRSESVYVTPDPTTTLRTRELAATIARGTTDRVDTVRAVEAWLRAHIRYQLDAPLPPSTQNAVDFLLFDSHAGFCEHFAAAEATMLRSLGIPSRIATGYSVGSNTSGTDGWTVVRDSDAHAWVEVWVTGHGWVSSDPTAGSALADASADLSPVQRAIAAWGSLWTTDSGRRVLAVAVLWLVAVGVAFLVVRRRRGSRAAVPALSAGGQPVPLAAFARLRAALAVGGAGAAPGDGVGGVRRAVGDDPELLRALDVVERTLYDRTKPGAEERLAAADLIDARAAALLAPDPSPV